MVNTVYLNPDGSIDSSISDALQTWVEQTISGGLITFAQTATYIDTEGDAALDYLENIAISGTPQIGETGTEIYLKSVSNDRVVTILHNEGNIFNPCGEDIVLDSIRKMVKLIYDGSYWVVFGCSGGANIFGGLDEEDIDEGEAVGCVGAGRAVGLITLIVEAAKLAVSGEIAEIGIAINPYFLLVGINNPPAVMSIAAMFKALVDDTGIDAVIDSGLYHDLNCYLFCADANSDGKFNSSEVGTALDFIGGESGDGWDIMLAIVSALGPTGLTNAVATSSITASDCDDCDTCTWCYEFDFTAGEHGWTIPDPPDRGVYSSGNGFACNQNLEGAANNTAVQIKRVFSSTITDIEVTYDLTLGTHGGQNVLAFFGATTLINDNPVAGGTDLTATWSGEEAVTSLGIQLAADVVSAPTTPNGSGVITKVKLEGYGSNPFGADNCP